MQFFQSRLSLLFLQCPHLAHYADSNCEIETLTLNKQSLLKVWERDTFSKKQININ